MSEKPLPFVVNDRRKFTSEGELRPDVELKPEALKPEAKVTTSAEATSVAENSTLHEASTGHREPPSVTSFPRAAEHQSSNSSAIYDTPYDTPQAASDELMEGAFEDDAAGLEGAPALAGEDMQDMPPPPNAEQQEQARIAYNATADRIETAIRATNPGMDHPPAMSFETVVQSVYMQAILQLGGGTQAGQQPQVDLLGARQSIDMLGILREKTAGNLSTPEQRLIDSALFELRLAFLEITQALARSAQSRAGQGPGAGPAAGAPMGGPRIVR